MVHVGDLNIVALVLADFIAVEEHGGECQILDQQSLLLVAIDTILTNFHLQVVCGVGVALNLNTTVVVLTEIVLLDVDHSALVFVDRVRQPPDVHSRVDLRTDQVAIYHAEEARVDEHEGT